MSESDYSLVQLIIPEEYYAVEKKKTQDSIKPLQRYQSLYYPTNTHNVKNAELLKHIKIMEVAPTCFGLQKFHYQGATAIA